MLVQIHVGDTGDKLKGFTIELGGASSESFEITNVSRDPRVSMYNSPEGIPGKNQERTYQINSVTETPNSITVYPILQNGASCDASASLTTVNNCTSY